MYLCACAFLIYDLTMKANPTMADEKNGKNTKRVVYLIGDVTEEKSSEFIKEMFRLEMDNPVSDIVVIIDSYGGYVDSMWAMQDTMQLLRCKVHTLCIGKAMSCGQMILIGGDKGCRYATPNSRIMMHEISSWAHGKVEDIKNYTEELYRMDKQFRDFIGKKTKLKKAQMNDMLKKDYTSFGDIDLKGW